MGNIQSRIRNQVAHAKCCVVEASDLVLFSSFLILGVKESSIDSLVFDTLIPKPIIQRYLNLLMEHRRIILSGPSGTGKSFLAAKLAEYIIYQMGQEVTEHNVASFNVDQNSSKVRRWFQNDGFYIMATIFCMIIHNWCLI